MIYPGNQVCQHIAAAILAGCDFIISWNFKHIVNVKTIQGIKAITTYEGYKDLMIYPPSALLEEEDEDYGSNDKGTEISERFDLDGIRKIREHNAVRYEHMTPAEIVADTKAGAADLLEIMKKRKHSQRQCKDLSTLRNSFKCAFSFYRK